MAGPVNTDIHLDAALSTIATAYRPLAADMIGDMIFPAVPVTKQSDKYFEWDKEYWLSLHVEERAAGDLYPEGTLKLSNTSYFANIFHLAKAINDEDRSNEDPAVQLEVTSAEWLADQFMLHREDKMATDFFKTGVWGTTVTLTGTDQWSDFANSDPITDIDTGLQTVQKATGRRPNTITMGQEVFDKLKVHPLLLDMYKHTTRGTLSKELVAEALGLPRILVGAAVKNTANPAATFSGSYIWGKNALLTWTPPAAGLRIPSAGYTFIWTGIQGGGGFDVPITSVREDMRDRDVIRGKTAWDQKAVGTDLGYIILNAVA